MVPDNERSGLGVAPLEDNSLGEGEGGQLELDREGG